MLSDSDATGLIALLGVPEAFLFAVLTLLASRAYSGLNTKRTDILKATQAKRHDLAASLASARLPAAALAAFAVVLAIIGLHPLVQLAQELLSTRGLSTPKWVLALILAASALVAAVTCVQGYRVFARLRTVQKGLH